MSDPPPAKKSSGLSLYGDLLAPKEGGVISAGPVRYDMKPKEPEPEAQKKKNAAFQLAPAIKRPTQKKGKSKPASSSLPRSSSTTGTAGDTSSPDKHPSNSTPQQPAGGQVLSYSEFIGNVDEDEDEELYIDNRPKWQGRGGKKRKNKKAKNEEEYQEVDWDAIYDPARPSNLALYQGSTEQDAERAEWTDFVHYHRDMAGKGAKKEKTQPRNNLFAPPPSLSFAPPVFDDAPLARNDPMDIDDDDYYPRLASNDKPHPEYHAPQPSFNPAATAAVPDDATGDDAYMRRMRISGMAQPSEMPPTEPPAGNTPPVVSSSPATPAQPAEMPSIDIAAKKAEAQARLAAVKAKIEAARGPGGNGPSPSAPPFSVPPPAAVPPQEPTDTGATISKAPVRYNLANEQIDALLDREEKAPQANQDSASQSPAPDQPKSKMPGQKGFGARMMAKMGWEKGQGLGAKGEGITTALVAQTSKRKKRSDQDGGGWAAPRNMGKIVGGKKRNVQSTEDDEGQFGTISNVVKLQGMLDDLDVTYEIEEKNLLQEIGEEFSKSYGAIERLFIWREESGGNNEVFVKFTNQLSALKAVNGTDSMTFAGNPVAARFFNAEKFEAGEYA